MKFRGQSIRRYQRYDNPRNSLEDREALTSKIDLIPEIDLAFVLLAAVTVTIILIRHGNKNHSGNLEGSVSWRRSTVL
ncbi:MAG: hypothetical protein OEY81_01365 [Candidatus Bathyarchaeota archaeon]|nr:hypothetical protein [Candidatus Bathyarchaeota archaeon]